MTLSLVFPGGAASDPPGREGRAALCMDLLTESTRRLDKVAFAEAQADLAADVSSFSGDEQMGIGVSALTRHLDRALDLFAEALLTPGLREVDLDRQIKRSLAGLKQQKGSPGGVSDRLDSFLLYGPRHPEGRIVTEASLATINVSDLVAELQLTQGRLAIELNLDILPRTKWAETQLQNGDKLEIVHFVGGG
mgnify:CR=1 FL=1